MKVYKAIRVFVLRPEVLSWTLGIVWALTVALITLIGWLSLEPNFFTNLFDVIFPFYQLSCSGILIGFFCGLVQGYLFGFMIGWFYSALIKCKITDERVEVFEYDPEKPVNIIQNGVGEKPYTIVIVANPAIENDSGEIHPDDIIKKYPDAFLKTVVRILRSFAQNELLKLPEILSKIRVATIFEKSPDLNNENALIHEYPDLHVLAPRKPDEEKTPLLSYPHEYVKRFPEIDCVDVIFLVSADTNLFISSARYSIDAPKSPGIPFKFTFGKNTNEFDKKVHAFDTQIPGIAAISAWDDRLKTPVHEFAHAMSSENNGAIVDEYIDKDENYWEERLRNNVINRKNRDCNYRISTRSLNNLTQQKDKLDDEKRSLLDQAIPLLKPYLGKVLANRDGLKAIFNELTKKMDATKSQIFEEIFDLIINETQYLPRIPKIFAKYQYENEEIVEYYSDRDRADKPMRWTSYVPAKQRPGVSCIMDIA
ncbi:hypothetical protein JW964_14910, partial [candidate division KSB1 bacterium]|nr:hypothetical protein [candidate division KSB1 bacterium]